MTDKKDVETENKIKDEVFISPKIDEYNKLLQKNPRSVIFVNLAEEYRKGRLFTEAVIVLEEGLKYHPNSIPALNMLSSIYYELQDMEKCKIFAEKVLNLKDDNIQAIKLLAKVYIYYHWMSDAKKALFKAYNINQEDPEIIRTLKEIDPEFKIDDICSDEDNVPNRQDKGNNDTYEKAPAGIGGTVTLARLYRDQGFYKKSLSILNKILGKDPMNPEAISLYEEIQAHISKKNIEKPGLGPDDAGKTEIKTGRLKSFLNNIRKKAKKR